MRTPIAATFLVAALCAAPTASADVTVGANVGSARADGGDFDGNDSSWKLHVGSSFTEFVGGEIGYVEFDGVTGNGAEIQAWAPAITVGVPVGTARFYGKGGVSFADVEGQGLADEYSDEEPFYGVGVSLGLLPGLGLRVEYERYQVGATDIDMAQAGLELRF